MEPVIQIDVTLTMSPRWHTELEKRLAQAKLEYDRPLLTMDEFLGWAVRYYLEHAYKETQPERLK